MSLPLTPSFQSIDDRGVQLFSGTGSPENVVVASVGALYVRTDGARGQQLYQKQSGTQTNTGWQVQPCWYSGTGSPENVITATVGALYIQTNGGSGQKLWMKESGTTSSGWVLQGTAGGVTGTGTDNTVPLWNGSAGLDNSVITQPSASSLMIFDGAAGTVTIGGEAALDVLGSASVTTKVTTPLTVTNDVEGYVATGTNVVGPTVEITGGRPRGNAMGGSVTISVWGGTASSGSGLGGQSVVPGLSIRPGVEDQTGSLTYAADVIVPALNIADATEGFFYLNSCADVPTGTPAYGNIAASSIAMIYNTNNNRLYMWNNGTWRSVLFS